MMYKTSGTTGSGSRNLDKQIGLQRIAARPIFLFVMRARQSEDPNGSLKLEDC